METDASHDRRDALAAAIALLVLAILWMVWRLYWQGALLLAVAGVFGYLGWYRVRGQSSPTSKAEPPAEKTDTAQAPPKADAKPERKGDRPKGKGGRKKGKKRKR